MHPDRYANRFGTPETASVRGYAERDRRRQYFRFPASSFRKLRLIEGRQSIDGLSGMPPGLPKLLSTILFRGLTTSEKFLELLARDGFGRDIPDIRLPSGSLRIRSERLSCPGACHGFQRLSPSRERNVIACSEVPVAPSHQPDGHASGAVFGDYVIEAPGPVNELKRLVTDGAPATRSTYHRRLRSRSFEVWRRVTAA